MAKEEWSLAAKVHGGNLVVWIEQGTDPNLERANSNGVCHALTHDWIERYTRYRDDRSEFVNAFRDNEGGRADGTSIPLDYISQQGLYQSQVESFNAALTSAKQLKGSMPADARRLLVDSLKRQQQSLYGDSAVVTRPKAGTSIVEVVNSFPVHPCYVALSFRARGGGHVVGFEFRPDVHVSGNFPQLFEYFDANLGLFAFPSRSSLLAFFLETVWPTIYAESYAGCTFQTAVTSVALGTGVGFGSDVSLEEEVFGSQLPQGVDAAGGAIRRVQIGGQWKTIDEIHLVVLQCADLIAEVGVEELLAQRDFPSACFPEVIPYRVQPVQKTSNIKLLAYFLRTLASPSVASRITMAKRAEFIRYIHHIASQVYFNAQYRDSWEWSVDT